MKELPIDLSKAVVIRKWSYIEWNMNHSGCSMDEFIKYQKELGIKTDAMVASHNQQLQSLDQILALFKTKPRILIGETLTKKQLEDASIIFAMGGDDNLKYISHFVENQPVLAINNDFERSEGALTYFLPDDIRFFLDNLEKGEYEIEQWPRLQATLLRPQKAPLKIRHLAISEIYVGAWARISMSKYSIDQDRHKDSGALIALPSGIGEGSWFSSAGGHFPEKQIYSSRQDEAVWYLSTEVWRGRTLPQSEIIKKFLKGESLELNYTSYYPGVVSIDPKEGSGRNYKISMGDRVLIEFADKPLRVIGRFNENNRG